MAISNHKSNTSIYINRLKCKKSKGFFHRWFKILAGNIGLLKIIIILIYVSCYKINFYLIGIIGIARSGKDTAADYICSKYDFAKFDFSADALEPLLKEKNINPTKENKSKFARTLRQKKGNDILAKILFKKLQKQQNKNIIISGFRCIEEINFFKSKTNKIKFIKILVDEKLLLQRGTKADIIRNKKDIDFLGFDKVLNYPGIQIQNNGTKQELFKRIDEVI